MNPQKPFKSYLVSGVAIDAATADQALTHILDLAATPTAAPTYVVQPYVEFLTRAATDPEITSLLNAAELRLANGIALQWAATFLYGGKRSFGRFVKTLFQIVLQPKAMNRLIPERIDSSNLTWPLLAAAGERGLRVFLIGSPKDQPIEETARYLKSKLTKLVICGTAPGTINAETTPALIKSLRDSSPDLILVATGFPLQERFMAEAVGALPHGVLLGEGGTFDYAQFGGRTKRAPKALRRLGLEWLWRLIKEPSRFRRQLAIPRFMYHTWKQRQEA